jgi:Ca2+-binding RTX toxin-like protein
VQGEAGRDTLYGDAGHDSLEGGAENDALNGGTGNDVLIGGAGADVLVGNAGADMFHLAVDPLAVDRVADFSGAAGDRLVLAGTGLAAGALDPLAFAGNNSGLATTAAHRVIYEMDAGRLWFDADGNAAAESRILVATFAALPSVTAAEILIG